jgi:quinolinate synthase
VAASRLDKSLNNLKLLFKICCNNMSRSAAKLLPQCGTIARSSQRRRCVVSASLLINKDEPSRSPFEQRRSQFFSSIPSAPPAQQISAFPSIIIGPDAIVPQGSFAEAQASFLEPPMELVEEMLDKLMELKIGIVAHYYMDVELQGILFAIKRRQMELLQSDNAGKIPKFPLVAIADSLKMGDDAVNMCSQSNVESIICLGVDFMSESVSAILGRNGFSHIPVYRATHKHIGCSLAESAEGLNYKAWLIKSASGKSKALHVVYINTSLETKATSSSIIPTITCTSSNVLQTILQASAQMGPEELRICYGPDTYMGENLVSLLTAVLDSNWSDERIKRDLHPAHDQASIRALRDNIDVYPSGNCVVHHMFGQSVVDTVMNDYSDAYVTAHLEVPGEMFQIALQKSLVDDGVVGSTSNILNFIERKVTEAAEKGEKKRLKFILGTEAGMVTSIVRSVQEILDSSSSKGVEAEIIFPVSSEAVMGVENDGSESPLTTLEVVPGVAGGEGCSTAGGCATCPFMKMNDLDAVQDILDMIGRCSSDESDTSRLQLSKHLPPNRLGGKQIDGRDAIDLGTEPIVYMREFMKSKKMSEGVVERIEKMAM